MVFIHFYFVDHCGLEVFLGDPRDLSHIKHRFTKLAVRNGVAAVHIVGATIWKLVLADEVNEVSVSLWDLFSDAWVCALENMSFPGDEMLLCHFFPLLKIFFLSFYNSFLPCLIISNLVKIIESCVSMMAIEQRLGRFKAIYGCSW